MEKVVIAGTGPAGLTAAVYLARAKLRPLVLEGLQPGGQLTTTTDVENFPGFPEGIDGTTLVMKIRAQAEHFGARFHRGELVDIDVSSQFPQVTMDDGHKITTMTLIIATGARARYLGIESEQKLIGRGVSGCATCDGALYRDVPIAVVGGGDTAMEDSLFLTRFASKVTVIHRRGEFRASKIMADRVMKHPKIEVRWNTVVDEVLDVTRNEVTGLRLKNLKTGVVDTVPIAAMFVAIGHEPNTKVFHGKLETNEQGYLLTDRTKTKVPGVFAAGDVQDPTYRQAVTAAGTGCMAALEAERYIGSIEH
jgi:thioredoxin reductase (NADPH)